jgi:glycerophosphoryl diester phosphodiesterase
MTADSHAWFREPGQPPLVIGHRGASALATENTLAAFRRAVAEGADGVELDVQLCETGEVVVFHDEDLRRLAGRPERIDHMPLHALRQTRLLAGGEIPTLAEVLDACSDALVNVELKTGGLFPSSALIDQVADVVAKARAEARVLVSSFSPVAVTLWRRKMSAVPCGLLFERPKPWHKPWPLRTNWLLPLVRPRAVHPDDVLCTPDAVRTWKRRGYAVNVWTVDAPQRIAELGALGVDGIITNDPAKARLALTLTLRSPGG